VKIFDTVIVVTSFVLDLVFAEVMTDSDGEQAAAVIMIFLLWRILRIVNGQLMRLFAIHLAFIHRESRQSMKKTHRKKHALHTHIHTQYTCGFSDILHSVNGY